MSQPKETSAAAPDSIRPASGLQRLRRQALELTRLGGPMAAVLAWAGIYLGLGLVLRLILLGIFRQETHPSLLGGIQTLGSGLVFDLTAVIFLCLPALAWLLLLPRRVQSWRWIRGGRWVLFTLSLFGLFYGAFTEYFFFDEFLARFNYIAVDYLIFPHEVFVNIWQSYPVVPVVLTCLLAAVSLGWLLRRPILAAPAAAWLPPMRLGVLALTSVLVLWAVYQVRGPSAEASSNDRVLREVTANGALSFFAALDTASLEYDAYYRTVDSDKAWQEVHELLNEGSPTPASTLRLVPGRPGSRKHNVVFIIEESLGSEFSKALGGRYDATPNLDRLGREGLLFDNVFATGNRTIRGLEASLVSLPPLPGQSVVKAHRQGGMATLASVLKEQGYETVFLYGGRGLFDNMADFMLANGFDRFIEQKDFADPLFTTAWGVSDEELFDKALTTMDSLAATGRPFLASILTVSNHRPYTYPTGRIAEDPAEKHRVNAVKYADYALGRFIDEARQRPYFEDTLFVAFGDHGARVYGSERIPLPSYRVPLLFLGVPDLLPAGRRSGVLGSAMDITPTVLDLLGLSYDSVFYGKSLVAEPMDYPWILMQHNRDLALFDGSSMIVLGLQGTAQAFRVGDDDALQVIQDWNPAVSRLERQAVATYQTAYEMVSQDRYRLPEDPSAEARLASRP